MKRKWIATMLTCTMLTAMLAGCGGDKGTDTQAPASDAPAETAQSGKQKIVRRKAIWKGRLPSGILSPREPVWTQYRRLQIPLWNCIRG